MVETTEPITTKWGEEQRGYSDLSKLGTRDPVTPGYFGRVGEQLFGCYHEPQGDVVKPGGFVLCYPMGREYIFSYRAFRQLAIRLSRAGFPVLRFDYYGCGDSAGDSTEGGVERWIGDITTAIDELQARSGVTRVYLAGLRLGATLAALLGVRQGNVEGLVLWDPIVDGVQYVEALIEAHARWSRLQVWRAKVTAGTGQTREILGFPLTLAMEQGLRSIALGGMVRRPAQQVLLVTSTDKVEVEGFGRQLEGLGVTVDQRGIPWPEFWIDTGELQDVLMPPVRILQAVVSWASEVCP